MSEQLAPHSAIEGKVEALGKKELFSFKCHPGVPCFNECCRELELALTPYDVLRLRQKLQLSSADFMDRHAIVEFTESHQFPMVYLGMVDDGRASCPFVRKQGCLVYPDRPGACRTYPVGRGAAMKKDKVVEEKYVLIREGHCRGFENNQKQNIKQWEEDQEIKKYNYYNDMSMSLTQHPKLRKGMRLSAEQVELYIAALYHLDTFNSSDLCREYIETASSQKLQPPGSPGEEFTLQCAIELLTREFFT